MHLHNQADFCGEWRASETIISLDKTKQISILFVLNLIGIGQILGSPVGYVFIPVCCWSMYHSRMLARPDVIND